MAINFNTDPYWDDFNAVGEDGLTPREKFNKILFRPAYPIQARELTQIQSLLQNQVASLSDHIFKNGSMVIPGGITVNPKIARIYVDSASVFEIGQGFTNTTADVIGKIVHVSDEGTAIFCNLTADSGVLVEGDILTLDNGTELTATTAGAAGLNIEGTSILVSIDNGIYYFDGNFIVVQEQTQVVNVDNNIGNYDIGFLVTENIVTSSADESLNDNAQGSNNYSAPGAHRLTVKCVLTSINKDVDELPSNFILLANVNNAIVTKLIKRSQYNILGDTIERRTHDESGHYTINPIRGKVRENIGGDLEKVSLSIEPTKAYISGKEINILSTVNVDVNRGREFDVEEALTVNIGLGNYFKVEGGENLPGKGDIVNLHNEDNAIVGSAIVDSIQSRGPTTANKFKDCFKAVIYQTQNDDITAPWYASIEIDSAGSLYPTAELWFNAMKNNGDKPLDGSYTKYMNVNDLNTVSGFGGTEYGNIAPYSPNNNPDNTWYDTYITTWINVHTEFTVVNKESQGINGYALAIDDVFIVSSDRANTAGISYDYTFTAGWHKIELGYHENTGLEWVNLGWNPRDYAAYISEINPSHEAGADDYKINVTNVQFNGTNYQSLPTISNEINGVMTYWWNSFEFNLGARPLLHKLPFDAVKSCSEFQYEVIKDVAGTNMPAVANNQVVFTSTGSGEVFTDFNSRDWTLIFHKMTKIGETTLNDTDVALNNSDWEIVSTNATDTQVTIQINTSPYDDYAIDAAMCKLIAPLKITTSAVGSKIISDQSELEIPTEYINTSGAYASIDFNAWVEIDILDLNDISNIYAYDEVNGTTEDITEYFEIDDGQTINSYGKAKIRLKQFTNYTLTSAQANYSRGTAGTTAEFHQLKIVYTNFIHSGNTSLFTVNSYGVNDLDLADIPKFQDVSLGNVVDFRTKAGNLAPSIRPETSFLTNIEYYLGRIDKVALNKDGKYEVTEGSSALNPPVPDSQDDAMTAFWLRIPPYTYSPKDIEIKHIENKRYTMKDIGNIAKRVNNLEYYTSLNMLETQAKSEQIFDESGLDRFKSGILVDSFNDSGVANVSSSEFHCSIDRHQGICRPTFEESNVGLVYDAANSSTQQTGDLITLPYIEETVISQLQASNSINVNPYEVFNWTGSLDLVPSSDDWKDVERLPDVIIQDNSKYDSLLVDMQRTTATGTIWNEWEYNWTGVDTATSSGRWSDGWRGGTHTVTTEFKTGERSRTGVLTTIESENLLEVTGDRLVDVSFIPFMRSRLVECVITRCKPNTRMYPFFDGIDVSNYCSTNTVPNPEELDHAQLLESLINTEKHPANADFNDAGKEITTGPDGRAEFTFWVPNNDNLQFGCGTKDLILVDRDDNDLDFISTSAVAEYRAVGLLERRESIITSTRVPKVVRRDTDETEDTRDGGQVIGTSNRIVTWVDPLAQSIKIDLSGGVFITSIDLFFSQRDEVTNLPVTVQLREMINGYPSQTVIPFGEVTLPWDSVNVTANNLDNTNSTTFTFPSPVYLQESREYCFVIMANCNEYYVHYGKLGERDDNDDMITQQPYGGVMFKSANASTWTPMQDSDLKFVINRAEFSTANHDVILKPEYIPSAKLDNNPFSITTGSSVITVNQYNHGLNDTDQVKFTNVSIESQNSEIADATFNVPMTVQNCEKNSYEIDLGAAIIPSSTGLYGGSMVIAQSNITWNSLYPIVQQLNLSGTIINWKLDTMYRDNYNEYSPITNRPMEVNSNFETNQLQYLLGDSNNTTDANPAGLRLVGVMGINNGKTNITPVIDLERTSVILVKNNINNPSSLADVTSLTDPIADDIYFPETHSYKGVAEAKYITKTVALENTSNSIKIWMDIHKPTGSDVEVYYKASHTDISDIEWVRIEQNVPVNDVDFTEVHFDSGDIANEFSLFAIKVVFKNKNTSRPSMIKNFRAIAVI